MGLKISSLVSGGSQKVVVKLAGGDVELDYNPLFYNRHFEIDNEAPTAETNERLHRMFLQAVKDWDLLGDDGKKLPLTIETLREIPNRLLNDMLIKAGEQTNITAKS